MKVKRMGCEFKVEKTERASKSKCGGPAMIEWIELRKQKWVS